MIESDMSCPITRGAFIHPLICTDGFSYEKTSIVNWLRYKDLSPMMGTKLASNALRENHNLRMFITAYTTLDNRLTSRKLDIVPSKETELFPSLKKKLDDTLEHYYKATIELDTCCKIMHKLYILRPNNFDVAINYANILRFTAKFDEALKIVKKAKMIRPGTLFLKYIKIRILGESGKSEKAIQCYRKTISKYKIEDHLLIETRFLSYSLISIGNRDKAYEVVSTYLQVVPKDRRVYSSLIYINLLWENYDFVIRESQKYIAENSDDISVMLNLAKAYVATNMNDKAIAVYRTIINLSVDKSIKAKAFYQSAVNRDIVKEFDEVVKDLEESYKLDPSEEADGCLTAIYANKGMYDKAEEWLNICAERINITKSKTYLRIKIQINEHKKAYSEAIANYIALAQIDSENTSLYNWKIEGLLQDQDQAQINLIKKLSQ